jgi:hypothetical protein
MNKFPKNEKGFGAVEALLIIAIVVLIGFVGWYVWKNKNKLNNANVPTISSTSSNKPAKSTSTKTTTSTPATSASTTNKIYTSQDAVTSTEKFYTSFVSYANSTPAPSSSQASQYFSSIQPDVTTALYNELLATTGYNPVTCSQQQLSSNVIVKLSSSSANEASMNVYEYNSSGSPNTSSPIQVTVELSDLKLTSITCPF